MRKSEWGRRKAEGRRWEGVKFGRWEVERVRGSGGDIEVGMGNVEGGDQRT
jgi:hypothetical protein